MIMFNIQKKSKDNNKGLVTLYTKLFKIFLVISILFILWAIFVALGVFILEMSPEWAALTLDSWVLVCCVLIGIFIILDVVFYLHYIFVIDKKLEFGEPAPEFIHGKRLYVYTRPKDSKGGIFSKTYIEIDENSVLRLRDLMVSSGELWNKKE